MLPYIGHATRLPPRSAALVALVRVALVRVALHQDLSGDTPRALADDILRILLANARLTSTGDARRAETRMHNGFGMD